MFQSWSCSRTVLVVGSSLLAIGLAGNAMGGTPRVAIVASAASSSTNLSFTDPQAKLANSGFFSGVDIINITDPNPTPTLNDLLQYDAIMVWSNNNMTDVNALGDVLADYVDAGKGVVITVFANTTTSASRILGGRWNSENYWIIPPALGATTATSNVGTIVLAGHPIMDGVTNIDSNNSGRPTTTTLTPHGQLVSRWADGKTLAAISTQFPTRVDIGLYPPSTGTGVTSWWDETTDGGRLLSNALLYAATSGGSACPADFNGMDGLTVQDIFDFLNAWFLGQATADFNAMNGVTVQDIFDFLNAWFVGCP